MDRRSTHHHLSSLNSIPQTHPPPLPTNISTTPIRRENDGDDGDDVIFLKTVPKVPHTADDYNPECKCSTCQLASKLMAECTCGECTGQLCNNANQKEVGQSKVQSSKNVTILREVNTPPNVQPFTSSSIQNEKDASTSDVHMKGTYQDDSSRNLTKRDDYLRRFFGEESESDSSSDDSEDDDDEDSDKMEFDHMSSSDDDHSSDSDYVCPSPNRSLKRPHHEISSKHYNKTTASVKRLKIRKKCAQNDTPSKGLLKSRKKEIAQMACPKCKRNFPSKSHLAIHLATHKKPGFRCAWIKCGYFYSRLSRAKDHVVADHLQVELANLQLINRHLIKVKPRTDQAEKFGHNQRSFNSPDRSRKLLNSSSESTSSESSSTASSSSASTSTESESSKSDSEQTDHQIKCPKCAKTFTGRSKLVSHYRCVHQEWKVYYCRWPKCHFASDVHEQVVHHANRKHFNSQNRQKAIKYVGKRKEATKFSRVKKAN